MAKKTTDDPAPAPADAAPTRAGGRRPDYTVRALDKQTQKKGTVGAAWANPNGSISVRFNPFVAFADLSELVVTLFPAGATNAD